MNKLMKPLLLTIALLFSTPAWAEMPYYSEVNKLLRAYKEKEDWVEPYLSGLMEGMLYSKKTEDFYCPPALMEQNSATAISAIQLAIGLDASLEKHPVGHVLVYGLEKAYPCL